MEKNVAALINDQINKEFYSAYLYLEMANYYDEYGLGGFANWYEIQAKEEEDHAMILYKYMHNSGEPVTLEAIAKPDCSFSAPIDPIKKADEHEKYVSSLIHAIYKAASENDDYRTMQFLEWFIKEQAEEEKNSGELLKKMEVYGSNPGALYMLDNEFKGRTYSAPDIDLD